jgi:hypothetical protein
VITLVFSCRVFVLNRSFFFLDELVVAAISSRMMLGEAMRYRKLWLRVDCGEPCSKEVPSGLLWRAAC